MKWSLILSCCSIITILLFTACSEPEQTSQAKAENPTQAMIRLVNEANSKVDALKNPYSLNAQRASHFFNLAQQATDGAQQVNYYAQYAYESLNAGNNEEAIKILEQLLPVIQQTNPPSPEGVRMVKRLLALAYFRIGEQTNCIDRPNTESCIFPISEQGVYTVTAATERSIQLFEEVLQMAPDDYEALWMLNLAYMTLGRHPKDVPAKWLIPREKFNSPIDFPRFPDVAAKAGFRDVALSGGLAVEDFNNDGLLDVMASSWGLNDQLRFYVNLGNGQFEERTQQAGLLGVTGGLNMTHADFDNDGWTDVLLLRGAWLASNGKIPNSMLRNNGDGTFTDVTLAAGLLSYHPTQTAAWADFNLDGWLDLFIGNESTFGTTDQECELYLSNGPDPETGMVTFSNHTATMGAGDIRGMIKGVTAGDINRDAFPDLYISYYDRPNKLLFNLGKEKGGAHEVNFRDITAYANIGAPVNTFPCWMWDYDNDGWEDIFTASFSALGSSASASALTAQYYKGLPTETQPYLFRNLGNGQFENVAPKMGLTEPMFAMGSSFGDVNNDGFLDMYIATGAPSFAALVPNKLYLNNKGKSFIDVTTASGTGHLQKGHSVGFGDFDNDGDEDIFCVLGGAFDGDVFGNSLFLNPAGNKNPHVTLLLEGRKVNRSAIGAWVVVNVVDPDGSIRSISRTVNTGGSFGGNSLQLEIGLGPATSIQDVTVVWPNREKTIEVFTGIALNQRVKLVEGSGKAEALPQKEFSW
jgi:hypothetical protein